MKLRLILLQALVLFPGAPLAAQPGTGFDACTCQQFLAGDDGCSCRDGGNLAADLQGCWAQVEVNLATGPRGEVIQFVPAALSFDFSRQPIPTMEVMPFDCRQPSAERCGRELFTLQVDRETTDSMSIDCNGTAEGGSPNRRLICEGFEIVTQPRDGATASVLLTTTDGDSLDVVFPKPGSEEPASGFSVCNVGPRSKMVTIDRTVKRDYKFIVELTKGGETFTDEHPSISSQGHD